MNLKSRVTSALAIIVFASFSLLPRKSVAMDLASQPSVGQYMPEQQEASSSEEWVGVALTVGKRPNISKQPGVLQQEIKSETPPPFSGSDEQLIGTIVMPVSISMQAQQSALVGRPSVSASVEARSIAPQSRLVSGTSTQMRGLLRRSFSYPGSRSVGPSQYPLDLGMSSIRPQDVHHSTSLSVCGIRLLRLDVSAASRQPYFTLPIAKQKCKHWNTMIHRYADKPQRLEKDLYDEKDPKIFSSDSTETNPLCVFADKDREKITTHTEELAGLKARPSQTGKGKKKGSVKGKEKAVESNTGTTYTYNPRKLIFDDTIPEGHYIESKRFINRHTTQSSAFDNKGNRLRYVDLGNGDFEGLVGVETSLIHRSTGDPESATHADAYMSKGDDWANIGDISPHTGIAREPMKAVKIRRYATWNP